MNVIYPYKIASKLFCVYWLMDQYFIYQIIICRSWRQNSVLPKPFHLLKHLTTFESSVRVLIIQVVNMHNYYNKFRSWPFHKNARTIRFIPFVPFYSLIISIHVRILEVLLKKILSKSYMLQTPRLLNNFHITFIV